MSLPLTYLEVPTAEEDDNSRVTTSHSPRKTDKLTLSFSPQVLSVRIACDGEVTELDKPKFEPTLVPASDPLFRSADDGDGNAISELSRFIGVPLAGRKDPIDAYYWQVNLHNAEAASLFRNCDLAAPERGSREGSRGTAFGAVHARWLADTGPVIVARVDRRPLHPLHVAAAAAFCGRYLRRPFQDCIDAEDERRGGAGAGVARV
jgi:hypothetical protein